MTRNKDTNGYQAQQELSKEQKNAIELLEKLSANLNNSENFPMDKEIKLCDFQDGVNFFSGKRLYIPKRLGVPWSWNQSISPTQITFNSGPKSRSATMFKYNSRKKSKKDTNPPMKLWIFHVFDQEVSAKFLYSFYWCTKFLKNGCEQAIIEKSDSMQLSPLPIAAFPVPRPVVFFPEGVRINQSTDDPVFPIPLEERMTINKSTDDPANCESKEDIVFEYDNIFPPRDSPTKFGTLYYTEM